MIEELNGLLMAGFAEAQANRYSASYHVSSVSCFLVQDDFPRIAREGVPDGVLTAGCAISSAACEPFRVPIDEVIKKH